MKEIFPETFTEGKVDFEKLKEILGDYREINDERYNFTWNGKGRALRISQTPSMGTLRPSKEDSKNWDTTENLYIEGDNLEVLKLLQKSYHNQIKMIYIDPPYNTGKDFVYKDDYRDNMKNYLRYTDQVDGEGKKISTNTETSGRYHTDWLNMMYPRLRLARNLLTDDGVIFISIDDNEVHNLRKVCDEIFGEDNFVGDIIWQSATDNNPTQISIEHEYLLCYVKEKETQDNWQIKSEKAELINKKYEQLKDIHNEDYALIREELRIWIRRNKDKLKGISHYNYVDKKGVYYPGNSSNTKPGGYRFDILHPITGKVCKKPEYGYRWTKETFLQADRNGDVEWGVDETTIPKIKKRIDTVSELLKSYYYEDNRIWTRNLTVLMEKKVFDNPKSLNLMKRIINFTSRHDSITLDFFAGSSTTAHAVMDLNAEDGGNRKFIMVQLPEPTDEKSEAYKAGYKNIAEIGKERIRRAGEKILGDNKDKEGIEDLDIGFKVFKLDKSNIKEWNPDYDNIEMTLEDMIDNFVPGRTEEDILYEVILKYGIDLSLPIKEETIHGKKVFNIGMGALFVCLDNDITLNLVEEIGKLKEALNPEISRVVFKDNGFKEDSIKTNAILILERYGIKGDEIKTI